jgi:hypothetical protein
VYALIAGPATVYVATREIGGRWRDALGLFAAPLAAGILAVGAAWALSQLLPHTRAGLWLRVATVLAVSGAIYLPLIRRLSPAAFQELIDRARAMAGRAPAAARPAVASNRATA